MLRISVKVKNREIFYRMKTRLVVLCNSQIKEAANLRHNTVRSIIIIPRKVKDSENYFRKKKNQINKIHDHRYYCFEYYRRTF